MEQLVQRHIAFDAVFKKGPRCHVPTNAPLVMYVTGWRPEAGFRRLRLVASDRIKNPPIKLL